MNKGRSSFECLRERDRQLPKNPLLPESSTFMVSRSKKGSRYPIRISDARGTEELISMCPKPNPFLPRTPRKCNATWLLAKIIETYFQTPNPNPYEIVISEIRKYTH
jgi:hypothetical protein